MIMNSFVKEYADKLEINPFIDCWGFEVYEVRSKIKGKDVTFKPSIYAIDMDGKEYLIDVVSEMREYFIKTNNDERTACITKYCKEYGIVYNLVTPSNRIFNGIVTNILEYRKKLEDCKIINLERNGALFDLNCENLFRMGFRKNWDETIYESEKVIIYNPKKAVEVVAYYLGVSSITGCFIFQEENFFKHTNGFIKQDNRYSLNSIFSGDNLVVSDIHRNEFFMLNNPIVNLHKITPHTPPLIDFHSKVKVLITSRMISKQGLVCDLDKITHSKDNILIKKGDIFQCNHSKWEVSMVNDTDKRVLLVNRSGEDVIKNGTTFDVMNGYYEPNTYENIFVDQHLENVLDNNFGKKEEVKPKVKTPIVYKKTTWQGTEPENNEDIFNQESF